MFVRNIYNTVVFGAWFIKEGITITLSTLLECIDKLAESEKGMILLLFIDAAFLALILVLMASK